MFTVKTTSNSQKVTRTKFLRVIKFPCSDGINPLVDTPLPSECNVERFNDLNGSNIFSFDYDWLIFKISNGVP